MKGFTLFSGGGGVDIAMQSLGVEVVGGVEYDDRIASVARANGLHSTTADILECNPADFPAHDWLHASPPCPNFSNAKANAVETENDLNLARKVAKWITVHKPQVFTLENVIAYRKSQSWRIILETLSASGYWVDVAHVNFADYGVPQTRKRMIVRAKLGAFIPYLRPTHDKDGCNGLPRWIGWYEAIEDLIPTLPLSTKRGACDYSPTGAGCKDTPECRGHFAKWQESRLPEEFGESLFIQAANSKSNGKIFNKKREPSRTVDTSSIPRALLVKNGDNYAPTPDGETPSFTVSATNSARAFIATIQGENSTTLDREDPAQTIATAHGAGKYRAFIAPGGNASSFSTRDQDEPTRAMGDVGRVGNVARAFVDNDRIVKMTPQAIARFQSFPDWYNLPDNASLAVRILGNAVPPVGFAAVCRDLF